MRLLVTGCAGSGKGTQSERLSSALQLPHISTGELLRESIRLGTPLGQCASECVAEGRLVPDALVYELVLRRLDRSDAREQGFVLDGFPRNVDQLDTLAGWLGPESLDAAVELVVTAEIAEQRMLARGRSDDTVAVIQERLDAFEHETRPMLCRLDADGLLTQLDADRSVPEVTEALFDALRTHSRAPRAIELLTPAQ
jgi:adenylate kinase